uniref:Uncharacterized protein n=1 Tax=Panagrolaimus sp. ES5 TaxID=591445 RepID=A0AC34GX19_9BILA
MEGNTFNSSAAGHLSVASPIASANTPSASRLRKSQVVRGNRRGTGPVDFEALSAAKEASNSSGTPVDPEQSDLSTKFANVTF